MNSQSIVSVKEFRRAIYACQELLSSQWHACVGDLEQISWFGCAFTAFKELNSLTCPRAKEEDINERERINDRFSVHVTKHQAIWSIARVYFSDEFDPNIAIEEIKKLIKGLGEFDYSIRFYTEALVNFSSKASDMKTRDWKNQISLALPARQQTVNEIEKLLMKTKRIIKLRQHQLEEGALRIQ